MPDGPEVTILPDLPQSYQYVLDMVERVTVVTNRLIKAQQDGLVLPPNVLAEYSTQLASAEEHRERLKQGLAVWWQLISEDRRQCSCGGHSSTKHPLTVLQIERWLQGATTSPNQTLKKDGWKALSDA